MYYMKFKWKLVMVFLSVTACGLWYSSLQYRNKLVSASLALDEEIKSLRKQLKLATQCRSCESPDVPSSPVLPVIYAITPTYARPVQEAELTRLSQSFRLVSDFHWIVIEDRRTPTPLIASLLERSKLKYTHLAVATPLTVTKMPRGVAQRNAGIDWIRANVSRAQEGVVYFADDDNTYDLRLFQEMRNTKTVSVWPVGLSGGLLVEKCLVDSITGRVIGWNSLSRRNRLFPVDMAGFAVGLRLFLSRPTARFSYSVNEEILKSLTTLDELQPRADNCTKVYVWLTRTIKY